MGVNKFFEIVQLVFVRHIKDDGDDDRMVLQVSCDLTKKTIIVRLLRFLLDFYRKLPVDDKISRAFTILFIEFVVPGFEMLAKLDLVFALCVPPSCWRPLPDILE